MEKTFCIYMHTSPSGKSYVGQTCDLHRREVVHRNTDGCRAFANAIKKHGWDSFVHEIIAEGLTLDKANQIEAEMIVKHGTLSPSGYNLRTGGGSPGFSEETRAKLSAAGKRRKAGDEQKKKLSALGKALPPERFAKMVAGAQKAREQQTGPHYNIGRKHGERHRKLTGEASKDRWADPEYRAKVVASRTGGKRSEETKAKIAESAKKQWAKRKVDGTNKEAPEATAKRAAALRETWRRKKEAAQGDLFSPSISG